MSADTYFHVISSLLLNGFEWVKKKIITEKKLKACRHHCDHHHAKCTKSEWMQVSYSSRRVLYCDNLLLYTFYIYLCFATTAFCLLYFARTYSDKYDYYCRATLFACHYSNALTLHSAPSYSSCIWCYECVLSLNVNE